MHLLITTHQRTLGTIYLLITMHLWSTLRFKGQCVFRVPFTSSVPYISSISFISWLSCVLRVPGIFVNLHKYDQSPGYHMSLKSKVSAEWHLTREGVPRQLAALSSATHFLFSGTKDLMPLGLPPLPGL